MVQCDSLKAASSTLPRHETLYESMLWLIQDGDKMKAKCNFVKVDCLATRIGKKLPVDLVGIVTDVGSLGRIKRQHDGTEFVRRCVCLSVDSLHAG